MMNGLEMVLHGKVAPPAGENGTRAAPTATWTSVHPGSARIGTNPEQLLAAGWSACFESAIALAAARRIAAGDAIDAEVI